MSGAARVAKAAPDGYTVLLSGSATLAQIPNLYKKAALQSTHRLRACGHPFGLVRILITRPDFPANTLAEFIAYAKANQASMQYGSAGAGSGLHICAVLLNEAMGTDITHVPYRGAGPAMQDLIAGRIDFIADEVRPRCRKSRGRTIKAIATLGLDERRGWRICRPRTNRA